MAFNDSTLTAEPYLRPVHDDDWPTIAIIANQSVAAVPGAPTQEEWVSHRRQFDATRGVRAHFLAQTATEVVGYGAVESISGDDRDEFRLFIVTPPEWLSLVGEYLYREAMAVLGRLGARRVRMTEYAGDQRLREFAEARGFSEQQRFRITDSTEAIVLLKELRPSARPEPGDTVG